MSDWRPATAWPIQLSDLDVAKIGLIAQADEQARQGALACLKALMNWDSEAWVKAQALKFFEITKKLATYAAAIKLELLSVIEALEAERVKTQPLRNRYVHSLWGNSANPGDICSYDFQSNVLSKPHDIDIALAAAVALTKAARLCVEAVAALISEGKITEGAVGKGLTFYWRDRWITF